MDLFSGRALFENAALRMPPILAGLFGPAGRGYRLRAMEATVRVKREVLTRLLEEARGNPAQECCGLLAGRDGVVTTLLPAENAQACATAYEIAPRDLFRLFRAMRAEGLAHMGIYHSHPTGENAPSPRDIESAFYPDVAWFIVSPLPDAPRPVRAFAIRDARATELKIVAV